MLKSYSCSSIEGGLVIWPDNYLTPCCHSIYSGVEHREMVQISHPKYFDAVAWRAMRNKIQINLDRGIIPYECQKCPFLIPSRSNARNLPFFTEINIINLKKCNVSCKFCYLKKDFRQCDVKFDPHVEMFNDIIEKGLVDHRTVIYWGGGEPALHPKLRALYILFASAGCRQHFDTNATIYMDFLEKDLALGRTTLSCSLMSPHVATYKDIIGRNFCERAWENATRYASTGGDVRAKFLMLPENSGQEIEFLKRCKQSGITIVNLDREIYGCKDVRKTQTLGLRAAYFKFTCEQLGIDILYGCSITYTHRFFQEIIKKFLYTIKNELRKKCNKRISKLTITISGKNSEALDQQVFLLGILSDVAPVSDMRLHIPQKNNFWSTKQYTYFNDEFYAYANYQNAILTFSVEYVTTLTLRFISHPWSGIITIYLNGNQISLLDLYSKTHGIIEFNILSRKVVRYNRIF